MRILTLLSGGADSAVLLALAKEQGAEPVGVHIQYGTKNAVHQQAASTKLANHFGIQLYIMFLQPMESYFDGSFKTFPGRNMIFAAKAAELAWADRAHMIWMGIHLKQPHTPLDCKPDFVEAMNRVIGITSDYEIGFQAPLLLKNKVQIIDQGLRLNVPFEMTHSCTTERTIACGKCMACMERIAAFNKLGKLDPLPYEKRA